MSREIKFRAWDKEAKQFTDETADWETLITLDGRMSPYPPKQNIILLQYTGLKDKNGIEIYEGDICKYYDSEPDDQEEFETSRGGYDGGWHDVELIGKVEWQEKTAGFTVGGTKWWSEKVEVIGNIYENKDLLK